MSPNPLNLLPHVFRIFFFNGNLKRTEPSVWVRSSAIFVVISLVATGCALIRLKKEFDWSLKSTVIIGRIYGKFAGGGPIIVAARSTNEEKRIAGYTVLHDSGEYEIAVGQGKYHIFAYHDKNSNLIYDPGEPAGQYGDPKVVRAPAVGVVYDIDIEIPEEGRSIAIPHGTVISPAGPHKLYSRQSGVIADLDDERFSEDYGIKGFWEYGTFFEELGGNIYFLHEYDPKKIPLLFIHGATGTPKGWKYMVDHIDQTRFQPWFFYYPSGTRIDSMAHLLLWKLTNLQTRYQFKEIYITAHSMGGLVARSFIVNYNATFPYVKLFISLATPWGGDRMAELGVKQSPVLIPSWIDMQPEGDFIKSLYRRKMPAHVSFYMFSGYRGSRNLFQSNNDGTIALSSLLDDRPQSEAIMNYAFNEDHVSILHSKKVATQYGKILEQFYEKESAQPHRSGGYLKVSFSYDFDSDGIRPRPILVLIPNDEESIETITYLSDEDNGKILGPFPSGDYFATMIAMAAKPQKKYVAVTIKDKRTSEIHFVFTADGVIRGCVTASLKPEEKYIGRPDYTYRAVDENIHIQSIQLKGKGIQRTPRPIEGDDARNDFLIERDDFCYNKCFGFFGLPAGDYTLTIDARGYNASETNYSVKPGVPKYFRITELTPD